MTTTGLRTFGLQKTRFYLNVIVNCQNCKIWGKEVLNEVSERPLHNDICTAWGALSANGIIDTLWFQEYSMNKTTNQERYRSVVDDFHGLLQRHQDLRFESVVSTGRPNTSHGNCDDEVPWWTVWGKRYFKEKRFFSRPQFIWLLSVWILQRQRVPQ